MRRYLTIRPGSPLPPRFEYRIEFTSAWDKRDSNHGIHGVEMRWYLIGPDDEGVIQFIVYTNWMLSMIGQSVVLPMSAPIPADLGYHSPVPILGDEYEPHECNMLKGGRCYYDGSGLNAQGVFDALVTEGGDAVWERMIEYYESTFGDS